MVRITGEFFLRGIDLLTHIQSGGLVSGLIFMVVWYAYLRDPAKPAIATREIARRLAMPYETIRRHAKRLVATGQCRATREGIAIVPAVARSGANIEILRRIYANAERMLIELTRCGLAHFQSPPAARRGRLSRGQMAVTLAATNQFLAGIHLLGGYWQGDLLRALVFTAIWTANVKHVTNARAMTRELLPDEVRQPVSVLAISNSLRLPYETVRRHALALERAGICKRFGRAGLVVPSAVHRDFASRAKTNYGQLVALLAELRQAGLQA